MKKIMERNKIPAIQFLRRGWINLLVLLTAMVYFSCDSSDSVEVVSFSPEGEVSTLTTFTVEFSQNLAPADTQDIWLEEEFIKFTPNIKGKFKWVSPSRLVFSPDAPLDPLQDYSAEITKKVLFSTVYDPDFEEYEFHTPDLKVNDINLFWTNIPNQYYKLTVQADITFNYPISPAVLKKFLEIKNNGKQVTNYNILTENPSEKISVGLGEVSQTDKEQDLTLYIKKGLESVYGKKPLKISKKLTKSLPPITALEITGVSSGFDGETGWIEVGATQMIDESKLKDYVKTNPSVPLHFSSSENMFRIEGDFTNIQLVDLKILKGLTGMYGGTLEDNYEQTVSLIDISPSVNFTEKKGSYMMLSGERNLQVNTVNVSGVDVEVSQVFKNNLVSFLDNYSYLDEYGYNYSYDYNPQYTAGNNGRPLYTESINLKNRKNWLEKFSINLNNAIKTGQTDKFRGIFIVNVMSVEDRWISDSKIIAISDLGIIAKKSQNEIVVFVNSIKEAEPIADVEISILSTNNQTLLSGKTNTEGIVRFKETNSKMTGFTPIIVTAEKDNDFNYIDLRKTLIETSRFEVEGSEEISSKFTAFTYSDRNIYRPGETVYLSSIIRTPDIKIPKDMPVFLKVLNPQGKLFGEYKKNLNQEGSFETSITLPVYTQTGEYTAEIFSGVDHLIGNYKFSVEDFIPDKIRLTVKPEKPYIKPSESQNIYADAEFLFGAKASNLKYQTYIALKPAAYTSKTFPDYDFTLNTTETPYFENVSFDGTLDDNGKATINYTAPQIQNIQGLVKATAYLSVFDLTSRTVNRIAEFNIFPKDEYVGIKSKGDYFSVNQNLNFDIAAVTKEDKMVSNKNISVTLVRYEWQNVLKKDYSDRFYYSSQESEIVEWNKEYSVSAGKKSLMFPVTKSGKYELRVSISGEEQYVKKTFYAYGWASATSSSFEVDREGRVEIVFDKEIYRPGDKAKVLFMAPFAGKMLLTIDKDGVLYNKYINLDKKSVQVEIPIFESYMPNAYITATLFKKHTAKVETPFLVAHGFASMKVEKKEYKIPVKLVNPEKVKPNTKHEIVIKTIPSKNVHITLSAVDEGILQIKNYKTPDPYSYMYAKRSLKVESYDLYKLLLPEILSLNSSIGGDDMFGGASAKRTNPITTKRFNLFAFWSGIKKSDANGIVKIPIDIKQFNGDIRLMAVAYTGSKFGSAESHIKVADDLIIEPEIPAFLTAGDKLTSPVTLINTTGKTISVTVNASVSGPLKITSKNSHTVSVKPNSTAQIQFELYAENKTGVGKITLQTNGSVSVKEEINISVRPASPLVVESGSGLLKSGKDETIKIPNNFIDGTFNSSIKISRFPIIKFAKQLKSLIGYPHGCLEQTVSKAFPLLYLGELAKLTIPDVFNNNSPSYFVKEAIRKIESMQLYDGSLSYWQGESYSSWWGSVYAAHFMIEAKKAGYSINDNVLNRLLAYLSRRAKENSTFEYVKYNKGNREVIKIANKEIIYSLYVIASAGKADISTMNYYKSKIHLVSNDMRYMLAASFAVAGQWNSYHKIVPKFFNSEVTERLSGGSFDSDLRANSLMLNILLDTEPSSKQIPELVKYLSDRAPDLYSTQEQAFFFLALGKAASRTAQSNLKVEIIVDNKTIGTFPAEGGKDLSIYDKNLRGKTIRLKPTGKGEVYYFWSSEGIKSSGKIKEADNNMAVRREYYDFRSGQRIGGNEFKQGSLIVCKLTLAGTGRSAENIVITDMIPAGFQIENPRLSDMNNLSWTSKNPLSVLSLDVRDDRVLLFTNLENGNTKEFYYILRVVNKGNFSLPVVGAEGMYNPDFRSYSGAGWITVN